MHDGLDADDMYIMVEDEFQTVAQSFTQHLHHAEYQRMKKKARDAGPKPLPAPTSNMRQETKAKLQASLLHGKQNAALNGMLNGAVRATAGKEEDEEEERENDPWLGTSLAGLMATDGPRHRTALVGLEKIASSTRAAKGYRRGEVDSPSERDEGSGAIEVSSGNSMFAKAKNDERGMDAEENDHDLKGSPRPRSSAMKPSPSLANVRRPSTVTKNGNVPPPSSGRDRLPRPGATKSAPKPVTETTKTSRPFSIRPRRAIDTLEDFDETQTDYTLFPKRFSASESRRSNDVMTGEQAKKKSRLNEIPTFLV